MDALPAVDRFRDVLSRVHYKDWTFRVGQDAPGLYWLQVQFVAPNNVTGAPVEPWGGRKWRLSAFMTDSEVVQTALKAVLTAEEHEAREKFTYRGRAIFGPHLEVELLWHLTGRADATSERAAA
jgi:hypothetical protein